MADYVITKADVVKATVGNVAPLTRTVVAGGTITAGKAVTIKVADGLAYLADATDADLDTISGMALNDGTAGQPVDFIEGGHVTVSAVGTAGDCVVMSQTAGGLASIADLVATNEVAVFGYFISTTQIKLAINNLGIEKG